MAKRGDPAVLRLVVIFLRSHAKMTQAHFGRAARVDQAEVSRYEMGQIAPSDAVLRRMAEASGLDWSLVVYLRQSYTSLLALAAQQTGTPVRKGLDLKILEPALLAVTPYLVGSPITQHHPSPDEELSEAKRIWHALDRHSVRVRRHLIQLSPRSGSWALALHACEASVKSSAQDASVALELAELALSIAERNQGKEGWRARLIGYCWAHIGHAQRIRNDYESADEAFARASDFWRAGDDSGPELLAEWRFLAMEASLRRDQRRFRQALELLDRAVASRGASSPAALLVLLLEKEYVFEQSGDIQGALAALEEAAPLLKDSADPRLVFAFSFKTVNSLCHLQRYEEAAKLLPRVQEIAGELSNAVDLIRVTWLRARVAAGQGLIDEAIACLEQVRRDFTNRQLVYDAALASLDLAALWLKTGRSAEVRELSVAMGWMFKARGINREALMSLKLFCDAARQESATAELARQVVIELEMVRHGVPE